MGAQATRASDVRFSHANAYVQARGDLRLPGTRRQAPASSSLTGTPEDNHHHEHANAARSRDASVLWPGLANRDREDAAYWSSRRQGPPFHADHLGRISCRCGVQTRNTGCAGRAVAADGLAICSQQRHRRFQRLAAVVFAAMCEGAVPFDGAENAAHRRAGSDRCAIAAYPRRMSCR